MNVISKSMDDLAKEPSSVLAEKVIKLRFAAEEKQRAVNVLRKALEHQREICNGMNEKFTKELDGRLQQQKEEYDATVRRHQAFIDQVFCTIMF